jgi:hypothetical protein
VDHAGPVKGVDGRTRAFRVVPVTSIILFVTLGVVAVASGDRLCARIDGWSGSVVVALDGAITWATVSAIQMDGRQRKACAEAQKVDLNSALSELIVIVRTGHVASLSLDVSLGVGRGCRLGGLRLKASGLGKCPHQTTAIALQLLTVKLAL